MLQHIEQAAENEGKRVLTSAYFIGMSEADSISYSTYHNLYFIDFCIYNKYCLDFFSFGF
jgi:hypothetical protein